MYYGIIAVSVVLFGVNFALNGQYQKRMSSGFFASFFLSALSACEGIVILFPMNGFRFEIAPFPLLMAACTAVNGILLMFCGLKTLGRANLSLYSLFMMLGGMALPSVMGVLFFDEGWHWAKGVCYLLLIAALAVTVEKGTQKGGYFYFFGAFVLNGMSGVIAKIYTHFSGETPQISTEGYSLLSAACTLILAGTLALISFFSAKKRPPLAAVFFGLGSGGLNQFANFLLLVAISHVPASVQYPMVTGGTMIVSTVIAAFSENKPTKKQWLAVFLSLLGTLVLLAVPEP